MAVVDHLVFGARDLASAIDSFERATGIRAEAGGAHLGLGTRNALVGLGESYLELIGPDPDQAAPVGQRPFGIDHLDGSRFVAFAIRPDVDESIDQLAERLGQAGFDPGPIVGMSRRRPDGVELSWRLTLPQLDSTPEIPFLIDWGETPNPSDTIVPQADLGELAVMTPRSADIRALYATLRVPVSVLNGEQSALIAPISGPGGDFGTRP